jgi:hypothetical protein
MSMMTRDICQHFDAFVLLDQIKDNRAQNNAGNERSKHFRHFKFAADDSKYFCRDKNDDDFD